MDGAYAHLAACYKRTTDHCIAELNGCLTPGAWLKSSCLAGCFFQESLLSRTLDLINHQGAGVQDVSVQGATSTQDPPAQTPPAAVSTKKQPRVAGTRQRRSRAS